MTCEICDEDHLEPGCFIDSMKEIGRFRAALNAESDRGCALMAASYLEEKARNLLRSIYIENAPLVEEELRHLSFADVVIQAYLLGLLPEKMKKDVDLIRKIRNEFAHTANSVNFETDSIADRCQCLHHASKFSRETKNYRSEFISASISIALCLMFEGLKHQHAIIPEDINYDEASHAPQLAILLTRKVYKSLEIDSSQESDNFQTAHWAQLGQALDIICKENDVTSHDSNSC